MRTLARNRLTSSYGPLLKSVHLAANFFPRFEAVGSYFKKFMILTEVVHLLMLLEYAQQIM